MIKNSDLMSREAAAAYLGIKPHTLAVWACTKRYGLSYVRVGRRVYYRQSTLDGWLSHRTVNLAPQEV